MEENNYQKYEKEYSEEKFWDKVKKFAKKAGVKVIYAALLLFYVLKSPNVSLQDKSIIYGALGYFIIPFDLIPDAMPVVGFTDDLAALVWGLKAVWSNVTPEIQRQAQDRLISWFGNVNQADLKLF